MTPGFFDNLFGGGGQSGGNSGSMFDEYKENRRHSKKGRVLRVVFEPELKKWDVSGRTAGFGQFDTKRDAVSKARSVYNSKDMYRGIQIEKKSGAIDSNRSVGDWQL